MQDMHGESPSSVPIGLPKNLEKLGDVRERAKTAFVELRKEAGTEQAEGLGEGQNDSFAKTPEGTLRLHEGKIKNIAANSLRKFAEKKGIDGKEALAAIEELEKDENFKLSLGGAVNYRGDLTAVSRDYLKTKALVVKKFKISDKDFDQVMGGVKDEYIKVSLVVHIMKDPKNQTPEKVAEFAKWNKERFDSQEGFKSGKKSPVKYAEDERMAYKRAVEEFGDEDAKRMWEAYEKGELDMDSKKANQVILADSTVGADVGMGDVAEAIGAADLAMESTGVNVSYSFLDGASIESPDGFSLPLKVGKGANGYSYYLQDSRSETGVVGPIKAQELAGKFDERYTDNFFTTKVSLLMNNNEEIAKIPDKVVVGVLYKLLGEGASRGFSFGKKQRAIMDTFAKVIVVEDGKYPTMYKKMMALAVSMQKESNVNYFVKNLANGVVKSVSEYISEGDAGGNMAD